MLPRRHCLKALQKTKDSPTLTTTVQQLPSKPTSNHHHHHRTTDPSFRFPSFTNSSASQTPTSLLRMQASVRASPRQTPLIQVPNTRTESCRVATELLDRSHRLQESIRHGRAPASWKLFENSALSNHTYRGSMMSVDETLMCNYEVAKPVSVKKFNAAECSLA